MNNMNSDYRAVVPARSGPYRGSALVGTYSAVIGWTLDDPAVRTGLLGFAIRRTDLDPETNEVLRVDWLGGYKRFAETDEGQADEVRSLEAPFQRFRWNDYTLKHTRKYIYEVFPVRGAPTAIIRDEPPLRFEIRPTAEDTGKLGVFVNRGVTASMAYLTRFRNRSPKEAGEAAYRWLSRGLKESLLGFIAAAMPGEELHVAIYEFFDHQVAQAFRDAIDRGVGVHIVHDAKENKKSTRENEAVIHHFGLEGNRTKRNTVNISHNKVVIRLANGKPVEVWAGSANFSENAFNFQTNTALIIRDNALSEHYEAYYQGLTDNPPKAKSKKINRKIMDRANVVAGRFAENVFFSPISKKDILETSVELIKSAGAAVFISAPFGMDKKMVEALMGNEDDIIEYGLVNASAKKKIEVFQNERGGKCKNTRFFTPSRLTTYMGRKWDANAFGAHKVHAKTIVIDPWSESPKVLIGSANFSKASCSDNDENALLITGDRRLAAIIATEFMRMYDHYKSRHYINLINEENKARRKQGKEPIQMDNHLESDDSWSVTAFDAHSPSHKFRDRIVFAGG